MLHHIVCSHLRPLSLSAARLTGVTVSNAEEARPHADKAKKISFRIPSSINTQRGAVCDSVCIEGTLSGYDVR
jgi:hypothetical protein